MVCEIPEHFQLLYSPGQIAEAVNRIGAQVDEWAAEVWQRSHTDILTIPVLRGGIFFFTDLVRRISHSIEITPAQTWAYEAAVNEVQRPEVKLDISQVPGRGRDLLLVDDVCDSGRTLDALKRALLANGARAVKSAVLIRRMIQGQTFAPDWSGFEYHGDEWFVGYGMEDSDRWRNLPGVHIIRRGADSENK